MSKAIKANDEIKPLQIESVQYNQEKDSVNQGSSNVGRFICFFKSNFSFVSFTNMIKHNIFIDSRNYGGIPFYNYISSYEKILDSSRNRSTSKGISIKWHIIS